MTDPNTLFAELEAAMAERSLPPVHLWHPERVADIDIRIASDGTWYHEGDPIRRPEMVSVFSTILRLDDDGFALVTPGEKLLIEVEDAPFVAIDCAIRGDGEDAELLFTTNTGDLVKADQQHPVTVTETDRGPRPYVEVRNGLLARIERSVFYRLVDLGLERDGALYIHSCGASFKLGQLDA